MSDGQSKNEPEAPLKPDSAVDSTAEERAADDSKAVGRGVRSAWQFPLIGVSLLAILAALVQRGVDSTPVADPAADLAMARQAVDVGDLDRAAEHLLAAEPHLAENVSLLGEYHLLVADHRANSVSPVVSAPVNQAAQVFQAYERAEQDGISLDLSRRFVMAKARLAAGEEADALERLDRISVELEAIDDLARLSVANRLRHDLRRRAIETSLAAGASVSEVRRDVDLLLAESPGIEIDAWAVLLDARLRLSDGSVENLVRDLGLAMHRLEGRTSDREDPLASIDWAGLWVVLGHAYREELGLPDRSAECYRIALDRLRATGRIAAEASLSLGDLEIEYALGEMNRGIFATDLADATSRFQAVLGITDATLEQKVLAQAGLMHLEVLRHDHLAAIEGMARLAVLVEAIGTGLGVARDRAIQVALEGAERSAKSAFEAEVFEAVTLHDATADYAIFIHRHGGTPADRRRGLEFLATARERAAGLILRPYLEGDDPRVEKAIEFVPVEVRLEAARRFAAAAEAMDEVEMELQGEDRDRFLVLWRAATLHDKAGAVQPALSRYVRFVESQSPAARLWPEAVYRVAAAHHSLRSLPEAEAWYRRLLEQMGAARDEVSEFTTRARVGLARVLMELGGESAIPEAESLLNHVLSGTARDAIEPRVPEYRLALLQLVRLLGETARWQDQAGRGNEWLERYPGDPRWGELAARTGAALLRHADEIRRLAMVEAAAANPSLASAVEEERVRALSLAGFRLEDAIRDLGGRTAAGLDPLESRLLRSAYLHRGIVADDRGDHAAAIRLHRDTEQRFAGEPVAIAALICMADVADRTGDRLVAAEATRRARKRLQHLHRESPGLASPIESLGPELFVGAGEETLSRWLSAFPPGVGVAVGVEEDQ